MKNLCVILASLLFGYGEMIFATALDEYIKLEDSSFSWNLEQVEQKEQAKIYTIAMTSQQWRSGDEVNEPLWRHRLTVIVPDQIRTHTVLMSISGGTFGNSRPPSPEDLSLLELAVRTEAIVCEITMVPNQPLKFADEWDPRYLDQGRREDALVAYTWDKFLKTEQSFWLLRLPMTKSVIRGMDACEQLLKKELNFDVDGFYVLGKSKRGWTAWCTAAVDARVKGIIPIVIDLLNLKESYLRQYRAYGQWSFAVRDYADIDLPNRWNSQAFARMMSIIEPYEYLPRFTMPKYLINASGDEFFLPDTSQLYFKDFVGEKHLLYLPNTGHRVQTEAFSDTLIAYLKFKIKGKDLPSYSWNLNGNCLKINASQKPISAKLWQAHNPKGRDFRVSTIGEAWVSTPLKAQLSGEYVVELPIPKEGWSAYFVELIFESPGEEKLRLSTDIYILPDLFPYTNPET